MAYWFKLKSTELVGEIAKRVEDFQDYARRINLIAVWLKNRAFYENRMFSDTISSDILDVGEVGELKAMTLNHYRNIIRHMYNNLAAASPSFDVSALNTDVQSRRACKIGKGVVDYYFKSKRVKKKLADVAEKALVYGDGYISVEFNPSIGRIISQSESGRVLREGDFQFKALSPFDVFFDPTKTSKDEWSWVTFRTRRNKYDVAALFPSSSARIKESEINLSDDPYYDFLRDRDYDVESDDIYLYSTYHKSTASLEGGKYILWAGSKDSPIALYEGLNPYNEELPLFYLSPAMYMETSFGFTEANILRGAQMALTLAVSSMLTNLSAGAANNIWTPRGSNLSVEKLSENMNHIQSDIKPEVVSFFVENPALVHMLNLCTSTMETLSGQNAVIRGNVRDTPNLKSGIALATVINQAQEYSQSLQIGYFELFEDIFSFVLKVLSKVAKTERIYEVAGKSNSTAAKSFVGEDLEGISRVVVSRVNPIAKTPAGQIEIASELLQMQVITPSQYFDVINTGNLSVATQSEERFHDYVAAVKEKLISGESVVPIAGLNHQAFIKEMQSLLLDVDLISNEENTVIVKNITQLIQGHMDIVRNGDELAAFIYGGQPPMPRELSIEEVGGDPSLLMPKEAPVGQGSPGMGGVNIKGAEKSVATTPGIQQGRALPVGSAGAASLAKPPIKNRMEPQP